MGSRVLVIDEQKGFNPSCRFILKSTTAVERFESRSKMIGILIHHNGPDSAGA